MRRPRSVVCGGLQLEVVWAAVCRGHCEEATVSCVWGATVRSSVGCSVQGTL